MPQSLRSAGGYTRRANSVYPLGVPGEDLPDAVARAASWFRERGRPAIFKMTAESVPAGLDAQGLPLGLQVVGRAFDEETVFAVGAALERAAAFEALPAVRAGA